MPQHPRSNLINRLGTHPEAFNLACILPTDEDGIYRVVGMYFKDWSDDRKADLYALLVESITPQQTFSARFVAIANALWRNERG
jgi:hypothetical protein